MAGYKNFLIGDTRGGRNGGDDPLLLGETQVQEALNIEWFASALGQKRPGSASKTAPGVSPAALNRHVPGATETAAELWWGCSQRMAAGSAFAAVTTTDTPADLPVVGASLNGKFFLAADSTVNRLHCWDGTVFRRVGLQKAAAPTVADNGVGALAAIQRWYKVSFSTQSGGVTLYRGELSSAVAFTPSGAGLSARVTKPANLAESETHWDLWVSANGANGPFYFIAATVIATTTYDDTAPPTFYITNAAAPLTGLNIPPPSPKYVISDGARLLMAGAYESATASGETTVKQNRVWFTRVLGSSDIGDDETIPNTTVQKNWVDIGEKGGRGEITGLSLAQDGIVYVFTRRSLWRLMPTTVDTAPYSPQLVSDQVGAIYHGSIVAAEDQNGNPAIYFLSMRGPYRVGVNGVEYVGRDVEDAILLDYSQSTPAVYYRNRHQLWFSVATRSPVNAFGVYVYLVFDTLLGRPGLGGIRGGWAICSIPADGQAASYTPLSMVMFSATPGASMSLDLVPWFYGTGFNGGGFPISILLDYSGGTQDAGANYQAYIKTRPYALAGLGQQFTVLQPYLMAKAQSGVSIQLTIDRDFGAETQTSTILLTAAGTESRIYDVFEGGQQSDMGIATFQIGDAAAANTTFNLDALVVPYKAQESR